MKKIACHFKIPAVAERMFQSARDMEKVSKTCH
jgi:hypothetical protein